MKEMRFQLTQAWEASGELFINNALPSSTTCRSEDL